MSNLTEAGIEAAALSLAGGAEPIKNWDALALPPAMGDHARYLPAMMEHYRTKARRAIEAYLSVP